MADTSPAYDWGIKLPLYARPGVPEAWIVDLGAGTIDAYRTPGPEGYAERRTYRPGEAIRPGEIGIEVPVDEVLV